MDGKIGLLFVLLWSTTCISDARQLTRSIVGGKGLRNDNVCTLCEEYTAQALNYLGDNKTQTEILELLHKSCSHLASFEQECISLVDSYANLFFSEISSVEPEEFCTKVNLCDKVAFLSSKLRDDSCEMCHRAVSEVLDKLQDPDTQMDIIQILLKACNTMENYAKKCKKMVFEYGPLILANAEQFLETNDICTTLHACKASTISNAAVLGTSSGVASS
ncbi:prosaposin-like [Rhodamnia argentea]|uniref:Prosaposin-like n=1 Tax=Rhodamnia argentea TaxID=178133 RepID=A0A8B8Q3Z6_9MYRT|nr:prosaposin-like [Rhodamnia argentea]XP_048141974.1 prosaposin-like [Rhodamnia argentea]